MKRVSTRLQLEMQLAMLDWCRSKFFHCFVFFCFVWCELNDERYVEIRSNLSEEQQKEVYFCWLVLMFVFFDVLFGHS
jgi:hypothetical protein